MKYSVILGAACCGAILLAACGKGKGLADGASGDMESYESSDVNAIVQAKPEIMIIPGDQTLKRFRALSAGSYGRVDRDYQKYLLADPRYSRPSSVLTPETFPFSITSSVTLLEKWISPPLALMVSLMFFITPGSLSLPMWG